MGSVVSGRRAPLHPPWSPVGSLSRVPAPSSSLSPSLPPPSSSSCSRSSSSSSSSHSPAPSPPLPFPLPSFPLFPLPSLSLPSPPRRRRLLLLPFSPVCFSQPGIHSGPEPERPGRRGPPLATRVRARRVRPSVLPPRPRRRPGQNQSLRRGRRDHSHEPQSQDLSPDEDVAIQRRDVTCPGTHSWWKWSGVSRPRPRAPTPGVGAWSPGCFLDPRGSTVACQKELYGCRWSGPFTDGQTEALRGTSARQDLSFPIF